MSLNIILKNNVIKTEKHLFKIKNLSNVVTSINNLEGAKISLEKSKINNCILKVYASDKNLNLNLSIIKFNLHLSNGKNIEIFGSKITTDIFQLINRSISKYDVITVSDIQVRSNSSFQGCIRPAPFQIQIL